MTKANVYRRPDGKVGHGFLIDFAGKEQHSVAWPDKPAERFTTDEAERRGIKVETLASQASELLGLELELSSQLSEMTAEKEKAEKQALYFMLEVESLTERNVRMSAALDEANKKLAESEESQPPESEQDPAAVASAESDPPTTDPPSTEADESDKPTESAE